MGASNSKGPDQSLLEAAKTGKLQAAQQAIIEGANVEAKDKVRFAYRFIWFCPSPVFLGPIFVIRRNIYSLTFRRKGTPRFRSQLLTDSDRLSIS
jgi:hypothetical protein